MSKSLISSTNKYATIDNSLLSFYYVQAWYLDWESISLPLHYSVWHCLLLAAFDEMRILFCPDVSICSDGNFSQLSFCISQHTVCIWQKWDYTFCTFLFVKKVIGHSHVSLHMERNDEAMTAATVMSVLFNTNKMSFLLWQHDTWGKVEAVFN